MGSSVKLEGISKKFGKVIAVENLHLDIRPGEFFALLGPSGCGKTTTLRIVAGLEKPDSGKVYIDENDVTDLPPWERDVAMVFQKYALYPHMTVYDNIAFPLKLRKMPREEIRKKVKEAAELLMIDDLLERYPNQLSGGQQQRVALARALVRQPRVFLMDEPLSNLDAKLRVEMRIELKRLQKELKITTIYVTHDQVEAMTMADRIAILNKGKLQQVGSPDELYYKPINTFVAGFLGSPPMNFINAFVVKEGDRLLLDIGVAKLEIPADVSKLLQEQLVEAAEVILGIRPRDIVIVEKLEHEGKNVIPGVVYVYEPLGDEAIVNVNLGSTIVKAIVPAYMKLSIDQKVFLKFREDRLYVFDRNSEMNIIYKLIKAS
ncbi:MAG: ABC transporter ATP-binding protein [Desulfurococcaceae archaeon]